MSERVPRTGEAIYSRTGRIAPNVAQIRAVIRQTDDGQWTVLDKERVMWWVQWDDAHGWTVP